MTDKATTPPLTGAELDLNKLEALARAATPGPWNWWTSNSSLRLTGADGRDGGVLHSYATRAHSDIACSTADQAFIAAANPATVLGLIAQARAQQETAAAEENIIAFGASLLGYASETDALDADEALTWVRKRWAEWSSQPPAPMCHAPAELLAEILTLAESGMCQGLVADDYCSQIVAKIKGAPEAAHADPMDWPLPCDVTVGAGTNKKGTPLRTLVARMKTLHSMAKEAFPKSAHAQQDAAPAGYVVDSDTGESIINVSLPVGTQVFTAAVAPSDATREADGPTIDLYHLALKHIRDTYVEAFGPLPIEITANNIDYHICEIIKESATGKAEESIGDDEKFHQMLSGVIIAGRGPLPSEKLVEKVNTLVSHINNWHTALSTGKAVAANAGGLADERAAFEAWGNELFNYGFEPGKRVNALDDAEYEHEGTQMAWEGWKARAAIAATTQATPVAKSEPLEPVEGDVLPSIDSKVLIHLARQDAWVEHTVAGYYVWPALQSQVKEGSKNVHRVFVRVRDANGYLNARLLSEVRPAAQASAKGGDAVGGEA